MKPIRRHRQFEKHFRQRISQDKKLTRQFQQRLEIFMSGVRDYPLHDHTLSGKLAGKRGFSVANDVRVVYTETEQAIIFLDIGSHNQVYK